MDEGENKTFEMQRNRVSRDLSAGFARGGRFLGALFTGDGNRRLGRFGLCQIDAAALPHHVKVIAVSGKPLVEIFPRVFLIHNCLYAF